MNLLGTIMATKVWDATKQRRLTEMYEANDYSTLEMSKELGVTQRTVYHHFREMGWKTDHLPRRYSPAGKITFTEQEDREIIDLKMQGLYCTMIAKKLCKPRAVVRRRIRELGLPNSSLLPLPVGKRYTALLILGPADSLPNPRTGYQVASSLVRCDCGKEVIVRNHALRCGNTRSCGCKIQSRNPDTPWIQVLHGYKNGATVRGAKFEITLEQLKSIGSMRCQYCGSQASNEKKGRRNGRSNGKVTLKYMRIDQISACEGYYLGNIVPCCYVCNRAKSNLSLKEFIAWLNLLGSTVTEESVVNAAIRIKDELAPHAGPEVGDTLSFRRALRLERTSPERLKEWKRTAQV